MERSSVWSAGFQATGTPVSGKRDARLRRPDKLRGRRPRWFVRTTDSGHAEPVAPNTPAPVFARAAMGGPDRVWASEITSLRTPRGWRYLAIVLDLAARQVVGGHARTTLGEDLPLALRPALVRAHEGSVSMSRRGNCYDNAVVESFFATLKIEWGATFDWDDEVATRRDLIDFIEVWYNRQRRHSTLGYLSPVAYEESLARPACAA